MKKNDSSSHDPNKLPASTSRRIEEALIKFFFIADRMDVEPTKYDQTGI